MKKISIILVVFILMISCLAINIIATEGDNQEDVAETTTEEVTEEIAQEEPAIVENKSVTIDTVGKIIKAGESTERVTGTVKDTIQEVTVEITEGDYNEEEFTTNYVLSYDIEGKIKGYELDIGDKVIVQITKDESGNVTAVVQDVIRSGYIAIIVVIFIASILVIGGKRGIKAVIALLITVLSIYFILLKGIYNGYNVIWSSIGTSAIIIVFDFIIIGGINKKVLTAAIGTLGGVVSTGLIATIFGHIAKMSGACEDAVYLSISMTTVDLDFRGLLFAGTIIASLGACMDMGMSIASSLDEIKSKMQDISWKELFKSGMNIGKDVIGTMTNTLILAYVGGSITLILLFMACNMSIVEILNKETIAQEIIAAISGSMGVVYTVPITAFAYAFLNRDKTVYKKTSENKIDGKRSLKI